MRTAIDGIERFETTQPRNCLTARRPHVGKVREMYEEALREKRMEHGCHDLPPEEMAAIRKEIRMQLDEEKTARFMGALIFLVIAAMAGAVIFMMTLG